ncbi:conserved hypothetical protein [Desulfamplus magnetovallimortis]|uniref:DUF2442 domain-containing protein n=1 Tax=Desulfamplus magnetovallimortis TaxID=1246637 RepID=A0A1W1H5G6_9BACT|nr:DUF2442 domain-containing protein [Desulfamplus magnetovallimortis]SLM27692.1 conserved hypothetical protein [Desulfamplus magnetovallimortis]
MTKCKSVKIDSGHLQVFLEDRRILFIPLDWYPSLVSASDSEQGNFNLIARGTMIEWPDLDIHIDIEELFNVGLNEIAA